MKLLILIALGVVATLAEESQVIKDFKAGYTQFTAAVYKELLKSHSGNFLVCPMSVDVILALVHNGAEGKTAQELSAGLHLPENKETIKQIFREITPHLRGNDKYDLTSANKMYIKNNYVFKDQFKETAVNVFGAEVQNIDFEKNVEAAAEMNGWVEKQTHDKIKDLIDKDGLDEDTFSVLINAMYFHGHWKKKFEVTDTHKRAFHVNSKKEVQVDMMTITEHFNYYENSEMNFKMLEMPYEGDDITMTIVLPNNVEGLSALENRIDDVIAAPKYNFEKVRVVLPKFTMSTTIQFKEIFQSLGVEKAFTDFADFSGISEKPVKISKIIQKTFIEVEEKGTTAAAATAVQMQFIRSGHAIIPPKEFIANHPFIYYLKSSAGILFIGRYIEN